MKELKVTNLIRGREKFFANVINENGIEYSLWYEPSSGEYSCSCRYSSFFRFAPRFKNVICRHAKQLIIEIDKQEKMRKEVKK